MTYSLKSSFSMLWPPFVNSIFFNNKLIQISLKIRIPNYINLKIHIVNYVFLKFNFNNLKLLNFKFN